jgi:hypothetical protein
MDLPAKTDRQPRVTDVESIFIRRNRDDITIRQSLFGPAQIGFRDEEKRALRADPFGDPKPAIRAGIGQPGMVLAMIG